VKAEASFLLQPTTLAQRMSCAKAKIRDATIPYRVPQADELPARVGAALAMVYLIFNEGYTTGPASAYRAAIDHCHNRREREFLVRQ
jgi:RNA polymerase sigma-70 factor (ECF subfamily)